MSQATVEAILALYWKMGGIYAEYAATFEASNAEARFDFANTARREEAKKMIEEWRGEAHGAETT